MTAPSARAQAQDNTELESEVAATAAGTQFRKNSEYKARARQAEAQVQELREFLAQAEGEARRADQTGTEERAYTRDLEQRITKIKPLETFYDMLSEYDCPAAIFALSKCGSAKVDARDDPRGIKHAYDAYINPLKELVITMGHRDEVRMEQQLARSRKENKALADDVLGVGYADVKWPRWR